MAQSWHKGLWMFCYLALEQQRFWLLCIWSSGVCHLSCEATWQFHTLFTVLLVAEDYRNPTFCNFTCKALRKSFTIRPLCTQVLPKPLPLQCEAAGQVQFFCSLTPQSANSMSDPVLLSSCRRSGHNLSQLKFDLFQYHIRIDISR